MSKLLEIATFERLLDGKNFIRFRGELLYWHEEKQAYVMTNLSCNADYSVADYDQLPEGAPIQLIRGKLKLMPSPIVIHQQVLGKLYVQLFQYVNLHSLGIVLPSPMDVRFDEQNVYQPDILFVSESRKHIVDRYINGVPDLVVEVISPGSEQLDRGEKMEVYEKYGVKEYWLVDPSQKQVEQYALKEEKLQKTQNTASKAFKSIVIENFELDLGSVF